VAMQPLTGGGGKLRHHAAAESSHLGVMPASESSSLHRKAIEMQQQRKRLIAAEISAAAAAHVKNGGYTSTGNNDRSRSCSFGSQLAAAAKISRLMPWRLAAYISLMRRNGRKRRKPAAKQKQPETAALSGVIANNKPMAAKAK